MIAACSFSVFGFPLSQSRPRLASLETDAPLRNLHQLGPLGRRAALAGAGSVLAGLGFGGVAPAQAVIKGDVVDDNEAAEVGAVGLWIDLSGCSVCRKGLPATCSGTLIAPDLVLSARHCIDVPSQLNGTLDRVVFGANMFDPGVLSSKVLSFKTTEEYGLDASAGGDLVLIKLATPVPWSNSTARSGQLRPLLLPTEWHRTPSAVGRPVRPSMPWNLPRTLQKPEGLAPRPYHDVAIPCSYARYQHTGPRHHRGGPWSCR